MSVQSAYQEEKERLASSLSEIVSQLQAIGPKYTGDDFTEQMLDLQREERKQRLEVAHREPYFGRIDFQELPNGEAKPLYIGKAGVAKAGGNELIVIDWRAPVASLFYSFTGGNDSATYESPDGEIEGLVHLKRNLMVRQGELVRLVDSFTRGQEEEAVTDEFLLYRLGENKDNKLRDIVSTIQHEQDRIIRSERSKALFIQGVAGSGKTTVALHRLAFLLYQYADRMRAERMVIFAPNRMFLDYISGVLPELGVGDIQQTTFTDWALALLNHEVALTSSADALAYWFEQPRTAEEAAISSGRIKGALSFKAIVDQRISEIESRIVPVIPFEPLPGLLLKPEKMEEWYNTDYGEESLMKKRDRLASRIRRWLESTLKEKGVHDKKLRAKANTKLNAFQKKIPAFTAPQLYATLFHGKQADSSIPKAIAAETTARLKNGQAEAADLAPLVYIHLKLYGLNMSAYDHIVIDEAQDYSPFQLEALRLCQSTPSMTVLGDLQQGIHDYAGIQSWDQLTDLFASEQTGYFELNRSYRSTMEIIEFANRILGAMGGGVKPAVPVFRSGDPVDVESYVNDDQRLLGIRQTVRQWQASGQYDTIAVIGRTTQQCEVIYEALLEEGLSPSIVRSKQPEYGGGLSVVPVYLSKGLEFDAVLICDAEDASYGAHDAKLLYVGCTRALHKLKLLHTGELTKLIAPEQLTIAP
ncbi:UvrD-helicase domain-containing protein [Paenibacillus sp. NEAU-GSW1]|uniref:HelD family protein n=1 Tax=Paenibacillus sp. NEAU-GSW1 TaxID=2682486 RepID=UPI0012E3010D|nr:UvrD-helicase domain-containing protein [Paenibacillus sp. NEAU-GSW1]MUT67044.1 AAA family ATPase [Paenibacillus sp. NEAU-GSW1]